MEFSINKTRWTILFGFDIRTLRKTKVTKRRRVVTINFLCFQWVFTQSTEDQMQLPGIV